MEGGGTSVPVPTKSTAAEVAIAAPLSDAKLSEFQQRLNMERSRNRGASKEEQASYERRVREMKQALADRKIASREEGHTHKSGARLLSRKLGERSR